MWMLLIIVIMFVLGLIALACLKPENASKEDKLPTSKDRRVRKAALVKYATTTLKRNGWKITQSPNDRCDFYASQGSLSFPFLCLDSSTQYFRSSERIIEFLEQERRYFKASRYQALVIVTNLGFSDVPANVLLKRDIISFNIAELASITNLIKFETDLPIEIELRERLLLEGNVNTCLNISARYFDKLGQHDCALEWATAAIGTRPLTAALFERFFYHLVYINDFEGATELAKQRLAVTRTDASALRAMLKLAYLNDDVEAINKWSRLLLAEVPNDASIYADLSKSYIKHRNNPAAFVEVVNALKIAPDSAMFLRQATRLATDLGKFESASLYANRLVASTPLDPLAHDSLAQVLLLENKLDAAMTAVGRAIELDPKNVAFLRKASRIMEQAGNYNAARQYLDQGVALAPNDPISFDILASFLLKQKNFPAATVAASTALSLSPDNRALLKKALRIAKASGDDALSVALLHRLVALEPSNSSAKEELHNLEKDPASSACPAVCPTSNR